VGFAGHAAQATFAPAAEDLPVSAFFAGFESVPDDPESEPGDFASAPEDFSLAAAESDEEEPFTLDPLAELRLSVR
jgi:hypothetical protein